MSLTRRGVLVEGMGQIYLAEPDADGDEAHTLRPLQAAAITYRIAFGPRAGQKVHTLRGAMPREDAARQPLRADSDGFSLHAAVRVEAHDRKRLEQLFGPGIDGVVHEVSAGRYHVVAWHMLTADRERRSPAAASRAV